jgi:hypothetical protein
MAMFATIEPNVSSGDPETKMGSASTLWYWYAAVAASFPHAPITENEDVTPGRKQGSLDLFKLLVASPSDAESIV